MRFFFAAVAVALPSVPSTPPAMPAMVEAVVEYRAALTIAELHDLNGPYREVVSRPARSVSSHTASPPGGNTGMGGDVEQWRPLVEAWFGANTDRALQVMACESGGNPNAVNASSGASGLFQFMPFWWRGEWDPFDPAENVARAASLSAGGSDWSHWSCKP